MAVEWWRIAAEIPFPLFTTALHDAYRLGLCDLLWNVAHDEDLQARSGFTG